jgi:hypothetical protein
VFCRILYNADDYYLQVAERVADERAEPCGKQCSVGHSIMLMIIIYR